MSDSNIMIPLLKTTGIAYKQGLYKYIYYYYPCLYAIPVVYTKTDLILRKDFNLPNDKFLSEIKKDFKLKLRGKILFKVLSVYLNARKRLVKYKTEALYEIGAKPVNKHPYMKRLILEINKKLGN
jgi:hypothetical protein